MNVEATNFKALGYFCQICGTQSDAIAEDQPCPRCKASFRSNELASLLVRLIDGGVGETLMRSAKSRGMAGRAILDFTGDRSLKNALGSHPDYRSLSLFPEREAKSELDFWIRFADRLETTDTACADIVLVRDVLRFVPDFDWFLDEMQRISRKGATVIFQDRFIWPFPATTKTLIEFREGELIERAPPAFAHIGKGRKLAVYREPGADFLQQLRSRGWSVNVDRVALAMDIYYRSMLITAVRR